MSYRVCRKFTGSLFRVGDHLCKVFLEPMEEYRPGFYRWNVGFAVGKSRRQLNDWYRRKKNRRARTLNQVMRGKAGLTAIQIIVTSTIVAHFIDSTGDLYLDVFSCRKFDSYEVTRTVDEFFMPKKIRVNFLTRQAG